ncbi:MAG: hypothetical protein MPW14_07310 [Candidatus Manganitrophus sp.]|nr:hypothetical protein [Candidatus Manganitrophus sp.]WDT71173.1 MAG: hypothetical protein MPW17_20960 [Candidatus Manganitrophus sp.]WDT81530.1 MAG: hypothetical protein MPW14_07310 [Candidatus Manganitrophus sp.]
MHWLIRKMKNEAWPFSTRYILWGVLFFVAVGAVVACGGGGSKGTSAGAPPAVTPEQAAAGAADTVGGASKSLLGSVGKSIGNSSAAETILNALGIPPDPDPTANLEAQLGEAIALILVNGQRTGDTITFDPDETQLCGDPQLGQITLLVGVDIGNPLQPCIDFYSHVTVVLTPGGNAEEGTLEIKYDNFVLATIDYSSGSVSLQLDLAQLKAIASAARPDVELPETLEGVVRATFTELGPDHGQFIFSILQAIRIIDAADDFNINIAAADEVFEFTADGPGATLTAELGLGALTAMFPVDDATGANSFPTNLNLSGATFRAELTAETLVITNIGLGSDPLTLDVVDSAGPEPDFSFGLVPFSVTLNGSDDTITFDQAYNSDFAIEDVLGLFSPSPDGTSDTGLTGTVNVAIPQDTKWTVLESTILTTEPVIRIDSGSATVTGTGFFPSENLTAGECFNLRPSFGFPLQAAALCPIP